MQCQGWRRYGGAFTLGPVTWSQCKNEAIIMLAVTQDGKTEQMPACQTCWQEAIDTKIEITSTKPILPDFAAEGI